MVGWEAAKEALMAAGVKDSHGSALPALQALLRCALQGRYPDERATAQAVLRAFCSCNADGQSMLAATLVPVGDADDGAQARPVP